MFSFLCLCCTPEYSQNLLVRDRSCIVVGGILSLSYCSSLSESGKEGERRVSWNVVVVHGNVCCIYAATRVRVCTTQFVCSASVQCMTCLTMEAR